MEGKIKVAPYRGDYTKVTYLHAKGERIANTCGGQISATNTVRLFSDDMPTGWLS